MNLFCVSIGVLIGWANLLLLPWVLSEKMNPLDSTVGYVMFVPLLIPIWLLGESGGPRCSSFTHRKLKWIENNTKYAVGKFLLFGWFHGFIFSIPSAVMITLSVYLTLNSSIGISLFVLAITGLIHLSLFCFSFYAAVVSISFWARNIYKTKRNACVSKLP